MVNIDQALFFAIYNFGKSIPFGKELIVFFGEYLVIFAVALFLTIAYREYRRDKNAVKYLLPLLYGSAASLLVLPLIRLLIPRLRPFIALSLPHTLTALSYSFPSAHTIFMFAFATGVYFVNKKLAWVLFVFGFLIGLARIAGGVHYPSDVLGGAVLGIITALVLHKIISRLLHNTHKETQ